MRQSKKELKQIEKKKNKKKILISSICIFLALCIIGLGVFFSIKIYKDSGVGLRNTIYAKSEHFKITDAMMSYFLYESYASFKEFFASYMSNFNLDTTKSLRSQYFDDDENGNEISWFDYFKNETKNYINELFILCEGAYKDNIVLSNEEKEICKERASQFNAKDFGRGVKQDDIRLCLEMTMLANKYKTKMYESIKVSDDEVNSYLLEHEDKYLYGHYREINIPFTDSTLRKIEDRIDKLRDVNNDEDFVKLLIEFNKLEGDTDPQKTVDATYKSALREDIALDENVVEAIFSGVEGKTIVIKGADAFYVYFVCKKPSYDVSKTKNVRQILFNKNQYGTNENAKSWADKVLNMYKENPTEEYYKQLCFFYSAEESSLYSFGLYRDVKESELVQNLNKWIFDETRKEGDVENIETYYGYHMLYYIGDGNYSYYGDIYDTIENEKYSSSLSDLSNKIMADTSITYDDNALKVIDM